MHRLVYNSGALKRVYKAPFDRSTLKGAITDEVSIAIVNTTDRQLVKARVLGGAIVLVIERY